ncbi:MAG: ABC transporter permease [Dehalococcoidia bacterium]
MSQIAQVDETAAIYFEAPGQPRTRRAARALRFWARRPAVVVAIAFAAILVFVAIFAPQLATHDPISTDPAARLESPSSAHLFGTDAVGHDTFSNIVYGARVSLLVGVLATVFGTILGCLIGLVSGYFRGALDGLIQRIMDGILSIPALILLLMFGALAGRGLWVVVLGLSIIIAPLAGRVMRSAVLSERENMYIEAARAVGATDLRVMSLHILPNVMPVIIVLSSITVGSAMLLEGALSFLGQGIQPNDPTWKTSWGAMLDPANIAYTEQQPWLAFFPGASLALAVLAFNMLGDFLRDVLDPHLRGLFGEKQ